ncbi:MAG: hypothetical protein JSU63_14470, partial [Phycisphaerales bacterium]
MNRKLLALGMVTLLSYWATPVTAHDHPAYYHGSGLQVPLWDWMSSLDDNLRVSHLSLPGTHNTMAYQGECANGLL